jgi:coenzyme F420-reducing hydrogenase delta subunit
MCSGRVEPEFVLEAFERGADGVVVMACHPGDCHYKEGNTKALGRARLFSRLLRERGVEPERFAMHYVSAVEGDRFVQIVTDMVDSLRALGPLRRPALEAG